MIDSTLDSGYGSSLVIDPTAAANLRKAGKWARFVGIVSMVSIGLVVVLLVLFGGSFFALALGTQAGGAAGGMIMGMVVLYGIFFAIVFYLTYLLYDFGAKALATVDRGDTMAMAESFASLGRLLKIFGILTIIQLIFTGIGVLSMVAGGMASFL